jgi:FkbM family methyltransferase
MNIKESGVLIQIGTNNGKDEFNDIVKASHPAKVILVEPNKELNNDIWANYVGIDNVFLENVAIMEKDCGVVSLCHPTNDGFDYLPYSNNCFSLLPMSMWGDKRIQITADSMSFNNLCRKYDITHIDFLQVDTEGYDYEIIKSIDFEHISIDVIKYEVWTFDETCYVEYGSNAKKYGINGMQAVDELLRSLGYTLAKEGEDIWNIVARKQRI